MDLTPLDIYNKEFNKTISFYSYDDIEVDSFLDRVAKAFEEVYNENQKLKEQIEQVEKDVEKYKKMEDALQEAILMAQKAADELKKSSQREARMIKEEARQEAESILEETEEKAREKERKYRELEKHEELFRIRFKSLLESHIKMLDSELDASEEIKEKVREVIGISENGRESPSDETDEPVGEKTNMDTGDGKR